MQTSLFPQTPPGFTVISNWLSTNEEKNLLSDFKTLPWKPYQFGAFQAKRQIAAFGMSDKRKLGHTGEVPGFIDPFRRRIADTFHVDPSILKGILCTYYPVSAPIGWHSDSPMYDKVFGFTLKADCNMQFRVQKGLKFDRLDVHLPARCAYAMLGPSRKPWEHRILSLEEERYSITFRSFASRQGSDDYVLKPEVTQT